MEAIREFFILIQGMANLISGAPTGATILMFVCGPVFMWWFVSPAVWFLKVGATILCRFAAKIIKE